MVVEFLFVNFITFLIFKFRPTHGTYSFSTHVDLKCWVRNNESLMDKKKDMCVKSHPLAALVHNTMHTFHSQLATMITRMTAVTGSTSVCATLLMNQKLISHCTVHSYICGRPETFRVKTDSVANHMKGAFSQTVPLTIRMNAATHIEYSTIYFSLNVITYD
jgi:hypothetical protein